MIYFGGCSITMGAGFLSQQSSSDIYPNVVAAELQQTVYNDAEGGSSNLKIFVKAAKSIVNRACREYVVQWSALHRHWVYPAPDRGFFIGADTDTNIVDKNFVAQYQLLNHDYSNIMSVIDYTRILGQMAHDAGVNIWFVNGMLPWTQDMLTRSQPSDYANSLYADITGPEQQIYKDQLANNLELLNWQQWINPWCSITDMQTDSAPLDNHPGAGTHRKLSNLILQVIDTHRG